MFSRVICPGIFIAFLLYMCYYKDGHMQKTRKKNHSFRRVAAAFLFAPEISGAFSITAYCTISAEP